MAEKKLGTEHPGIDLKTPGYLVQKVEKSDTEVVGYTPSEYGVLPVAEDGDKDLLTKRDMNVRAGRDINFTAQGDMNEHLAGNHSEFVAGAVTQTANGPVTQNHSGGSTNITKE